jgi:hypothetical protein
MNSDPLLAAIETVEAAGRTAEQLLAEAVATLAPVREARKKGTPLPEIWNASMAAAAPAKRQEAASALKAFERAAMLFRSTVIRELVNDHGWSLTRVARDLGTSRQMVSRLYNHPRND